MGAFSFIFLKFITDFCFSNKKNPHPASSPNMAHPMQLRVLAVGDTLTDKSATLQYMDEGRADMGIPCTIGVDFKRFTVPLPGSKVPTRVIWWDTAGQERFRNTSMYSHFKGAQCVVAFYSVSSAKTLDGAIDLVHQLYQTWSTSPSREGKAPIILVGACAHLECERAVTTQEGVAAARKLQHEAQEYV